MHLACRAAAKSRDVLISSGFHADSVRAPHGCEHLPRAGWTARSLGNLQRLELARNARRLSAARQGARLFHVAHQLLLERVGAGEYLRLTDPPDEVDPQV